MMWIDLRSDTVTQPTGAMREAMFTAAVGDDVYGEDPTVCALEDTMADMLGFEAALFVASGTMGNLVAVLTHAGRGDEVIIGDRSHTFLYEAGGISALGGVHPHTIPNDDDGTLALDAILEAIRTDNIHFPRSRALCLENTHNRCGGTVLGIEYVDSACELAHEHGLAVHLDGARLLNAATALGVPASELTRHVDSVMICLSKGLGAPVGSVLCGSRRFIEQALRIRKLVGGGMRQAGILAAAGMFALSHHVDRLADDHRRATCLAEGISAIPGLRLLGSGPGGMPETNLVYFEIDRNAGDDASKTL
ncbi:low-specificity L-threonine aldolase, partial [Candidatus Bipolaricaulota bacterium]|nr:low-specificity L-threonine aldolase [Candidatus Bipolaricaulota bacterium]